MKANRQQRSLDFNVKTYTLSGEDPDYSGATDVIATLSLKGPLGQNGVLILFKRDGSQFHLPYFCAQNFALIEMRKSQLPALLYMLEHRECRVQVAEPNLDGTGAFAHVSDYSEKKTIKPNDSINGRAPVSIGNWDLQLSGHVDNISARPGAGVLTINYKNGGSANIDFRVQNIRAHDDRIPIQGEIQVDRVHPLMVLIDNYECIVEIPKGPNIAWKIECAANELIQP